MGEIILNGKSYANNKPDGYPPVIYSGEEREIGVWTDGKPLYQKTIAGTTVVGGTTTDKPHGISNIDEVANVEILCHFSDNGFWRALNFAYNNGAVNENWLAGFAIDSTNIKFQIGTSFASTLDKWRATIQYTKTTDIAGSGKWTTQGTPTHHYSTNEHIIGTWIDGKPLYEKVIVNDTALSGTSLTIDTSSLNANYIKVTDFCFVVKPSGEPTIYTPLTYYNGSGYGYINTVKPTGISVNWTSNISSRTGNGYICIIQYTKTTD